MSGRGAGRGGRHAAIAESPIPTGLRPARQRHPAAWIVRRNDADQPPVLVVGDAREKFQMFTPFLS
jgi:hypothetical protein